jgi:light-regulated signal transduction histidine kinase (bacteriophytochrome)
MASASGTLSYAHALLNILEDTASEKLELHQTQRAVLNILEDAAREKDQLEQTQRAALNILEDAAAETDHLHETQSAALNILEDFAHDKDHLEDMKKSVLNILEDLGVEKQQLSERSLEAEAANKELEAFAYSVSHDLRAPLRGIDGWSAALLEDYGGRLDERAQQYMERVRNETQRLGRLIDDLLHLSRMSRVEMERRPVDLSELARSVAARLTETHAARKLEFAIQPGLTASADATLLEVAVTNLLDNAVKFTGRRTEARIEIGETETQGIRAFFVRDNGAGFDMAYVGTLFGAFQRLHRVSDFPGTGIGLATVQRVIRRHGGRVWGESAVDQGATFFFTLGSPHEAKMDHSGRYGLEEGHTLK